MHFIITRPFENCDILKQHLPSEFVTYAPIMHYGEIKDALHIQNAHEHDYIVTSQYAAKMIVQHYFAPHSTYYCVGPITEKILQKQGYKTITPTVHNAKSLTEVIKNEHKPKKKLLYLCGETIKNPIHAELQHQGIPCTKHIIYKTTPAQNNWHYILRFKGMKTIVFYSKQSYDLFIKDIQIHHDVTDLSVCRAIWVLPAASAIKANDYTNNVTWKKISVINSTNDLIQFIHKETSP